MLFGEISEIVFGMEQGTIPYSFGKLDMATKRSPMEALDAAMGGPYTDVVFRKLVPSEKTLRQLVKDLKSFNKYYKVKQMDHKIQQLEDFIEEKPKK